MGNKWNSRSTVLSILSLVLTVTFLMFSWRTNNKIMELSQELAIEGKAVPIVYSDIVRSFPLGEIVIGTLTLLITKVGRDGYIRGRANRESKES